MPEVFHVATRPPYPPQPVGPGHVPETVFALTPAPFMADFGVNAAITRRYPSGVSSHGAQYLTGCPVDDAQRVSWAAEAVWEGVRASEFPDKPSRMTSWFACETLEDAHAFAGQFRFNQFVDIWRAEATVTHRGNMSLLNAIGVPVAVAHERAAAYWRGERGPASTLWEVLVEPGMRLIEIVTSNAPGA